MLEIREVRLANLRALLASEPGPERGRQARFARRIAKSPAQLSQWLIGYRTLDDEAVRAIEAKLGLKRWAFDDPNWTNDQAPEPAQAHALSLSPFETPPLVSVEDLMQSKELPACFVAEIPDGALTGKFEQGTRVVFEVGAAPKVGAPVLVADRDGQRWVRIYGNVRGDRWQALATGLGHVSLDSEADGLVVLAAARWVEI